MANNEVVIRVRAQDDASGPMKRATDSMAASLKHVGEIAGGFFVAQVGGKALGAITNFVSGSVDAAKDLGESVNAVGKIFGDSSKEILDWGKNNANALGLSQRAFNQLATPLGAILKNSGIEDFAGQTVQLTQRAADLASVFNVDVADALEAIQSGLKGEADPLERFGVGLSAAKVEARALADTGKTVASSLTDQEKSLARLAIIYDQTASVAGDFADTSDQLANKERIAAARKEELAAKIGGVLLPVQLKWTELQLKAVDIIIGKVIPALDAFIKYIQFVISDGDKLNDWLTRIPGPLQGLAQTVADVVLFVKAHWETFMAVFDLAKSYVQARIEGTIQVITSIVSIVQNVVALVQAVIRGDWSQAWSEMKQIVSESVDLAVGYVRMMFGNLPELLIELAARAAGAALDFGRGIADGLLEGIESIPGRVRSVLNDAISWLNSYINRVSGMELIPGNTKGPVTWGPVTMPNLPNIPQLATGGRVNAGDPYIVGERGPELFVPGANGQIVPNNALSGGDRIVYIPVTGAPDFDRLVERVIRDAIQGGGFRGLIGAS